MKKLIYSMLVLALIAMTFVNCENVNQPIPKVQAHRQIHLM